MHRSKRTIHGTRSLLAKSTLLLLVPLAGTLATPAWAAAGGAGAGDQAQAAVITGVVRDAAGAVQMGALVQVLGQGSRTVATAFTDMHGRYTIAGLAAGRYVVRASAALFVPASKANLELRRGTSAVVDLTLAALFDPASWLPAERRRADEAVDDWKWTLRSSASRPILRDVSEDDAEATAPVAEGGKPVRPELRGEDTVAAGGGFCDGALHDTLRLSRTDAAGIAQLEATLATSAGGSSNQASNGSARLAASLSGTTGLAVRAAPLSAIRRIRRRLSPRRRVASGSQGSRSLRSPARSG